MVKKDLWNPTPRWAPTINRSRCRDARREMTADAAMQEDLKYKGRLQKSVLSGKGEAQ